MLRTEPLPSDPEEVRRIIESSGFFSAEETGIAVELVEEHLRRGVASGYYFLFLHADGPGTPMTAYACYGPTPCTVGTFDLYWIAVDQVRRCGGLGGRLLGEVESRVRGMGGRLLMVDTAGRPQYGPTREFYVRNGYAEVAVIPDFYAPGDAKHVYRKIL